MTVPADINNERPYPPVDADCELCQADRFTHWYRVTEDGWVADCEVCAVPMVVWWGHGPEASPQVRSRLLEALTEVANERFGPDQWTLDTTMRQVPEHLHAHARDTGWWERRFSRAMSRYTGVGGDRVVR